MIRYPILHSGYVSGTDTHLSKTNYVANPFVENVLFRQSGNNSYANLFYNQDITEAFKKFEADRNKLRDFDFREEVLVLASSLFGKRGLNEWIDMQGRYAKLSYSHSSFLIDTLNFIVSGGRDMSVASWQNLVKNTPNGENIEFSKLKEMEELRRNYNSVVNGTTSEILNIWVSHRGGYEDLLYTLWIIFGDKQYGNHVVVQKTGA